MDLRITNEQGTDLSSCYVTFHELQLKEFHPFIATTRWDQVYIDVNQDTPRGIIRQMRFNVPVHVKMNDEVTPNMLSVLCEIFRDEAAALRTYFRTDKDKFKAEINRLVEM